MAAKRQDAEFRHPDTVAYLQGLTDEEAAKHSPIVRERDGVLTQQRRVGRRVRCREVEASGDPASGTGALDVLMRSADGAEPPDRGDAPDAPWRDPGRADLRLLLRLRRRPLPFGSGVVESAC